MDENRQYEASMKRHPPAFDVVSQTIDYNNPRIKKHAEGKCGTFLKESLECYIKSESNIRGIDCTDKFKFFASML